MNENQHDKMPAHDIDDLFRSAIEPLEVRPPSSVWETVEKDLDRHNIINIKRKYNTVKKIAIALALLLSSTLLYEFRTQRATGQNKFAGQKGIYRLPSGDNRDNLIEKPVIEKQPANGMRNHLIQQIPADGAITRSSATPDFADGTKKPFSVSTKNLKLSAQHHLESSERDKDQPRVPNKLYEKQFGNNGYDLERSAAAKDRQVSGERLATADLLFYSFPTVEELPVAGNSGKKTPVIADDISNYDQSPVIKKWAGGDGVPTLAKQAIKLAEGKRSFSLSLIFSPDFTSRVLREDWPINREDNRDEIKKSERYAFSYSFGASVDYNISKHWGIQSGFALSRAVINIDPKFIFARPDDLGDVRYKFNSSSGYSFLSPHSAARPVLGDSLHAFASSSALLYLSIPVAVKYTLTSGRLDFYTTTGIAANILVKDKIKTSLFNGGNRENAINHDIRGLKPVYYSALLSAGVSYNISNTLAVSFAPTARLALTSINKYAPVRAYQHSLGLVGGLQVSF